MPSRPRIAAAALVAASLFAAGAAAADKPRKAACPKKAPSLRTLPVPLGAVTGAGLPGQVRGGHYKGHGYLRVASNATRVVLPVAATLYEGSRYVEGGEVQYLLYFRAACGLVLLFDHVLEPAPAVLAAFAGKPEPKPDDSRTYALKQVKLAAGATVATAVGFRQTGNAAVDFGAFDLTKPNAASKRPGFRGNRGTWRDANALCWPDLYGPSVAAKLRALAGESVEGSASDVC